jgi:uncharacterized repeat protein (TIGR01451 family)
MTTMMPRRRWMNLALGVLLSGVAILLSGDEASRADCEPCPEPCEAPGVPEVPPPIVALQVLVPAQGSVDQELPYRIVAENRSPAPAHHVVVHAALPGNVRYLRAEPEPSAIDHLSPQPPSPDRRGGQGGEVLQWRLGTLNGGERREIGLVLTPTGPGDVTACVRVTFEHGVCLTTKICGPPPAPEPTPPPLQAALKVQKRGPVEAVVGETVTYQLSVTNTGEGPAANVYLTDSLPDGLSYIPTGQPKLVYPIGNLGPGETRAVTYQAAVKSTGRLANRVVATADGGLRDEQEWIVNVTEPRLDLTKTGPAQRYLNQSIPYRLTVSNSGTGTAKNVMLVDRLPPGTRFVSASDNGRQAGGNVQWLLGDLPAGGSRSVDLRIQATAAGEILNLADATADRGLRTTAQAKTEILGLAALLLEVVDADDPVEVGSDTRYTIIVRNQGSLPATKVQIVVTAPAELAVTRVQGPAKHEKDGQKVTFEPLTIPANADAIYRVTVRALKPGDVRFRAEMTADQLPTGKVLEEESTNIYADVNGNARRP